MEKGDIKDASSFVCHSKHRMFMVPSDSIHLLKHLPKLGLIVIYEPGSHNYQLSFLVCCSFAVNFKVTGAGFPQSTH